MDSEVRSRRVVFGVCRRCGVNDAFFYPTILCDECHKDWGKLSVFEAGSEARRKAVECFYVGEKMEVILNGL